MLKSIAIFCLICTFPFAGFSGSNLLADFQFADSLKSAGENNWAALEYERICYTTFDNRIRTVALNAKSECLLAMYNAKAAQKTLMRINYYGLNDSLVYASRYNTAFASYLNKDFEQTKSQFFLVEQFLPLEYHIQAAPLYALALNETREWDKAEQKLLLWAEHSEMETRTKDSLTCVIQNLYRSKDQPRFRDPEKAKLWSSFIPSSGQLYAGYFWDAAFSAFMMATGLGIAAVGIFVVKYYVAGIVIGYGLFQRFYMAGVKRADFLARRRNFRDGRAYNDKLQAFILSLE